MIEDVSRNGKRGLRYNFHAGQLQAWRSDKRIVFILSGSQGGKTSFGPPWLHREIQRRGAGDYLIVAPSYPLLDKAARPALQSLLETKLQLGSMSRSPMEFRFSPQGEMRTWGARQDRPTRIIFGHADEPESLEAATIKAAWLDEAGQKRFKLESWEAIWTRRLAVEQGRVLITTTPYAIGWLKSELHDPWVSSKGQHADIDLIRFTSVMNPVFSREQYELAKRNLPRWKFDLFFRARFSRPAGAIFDNFDPAIHVWPRFTIPEHWPRYVGLDFGGINTAGIFWAQELTPNGEPLANVDGLQRFAPGPMDKPTGRYFAYREYWPREARTAAQHKADLVRGEPRLPVCAGGAKSEGQWRMEFSRAGMPIQAPLVTDVEVGINRLYGFFARNQLIIFDDLVNYIDELNSYSRALDEFGEPTEAIEDKDTYHLIDANRYLAVYLDRQAIGSWRMERI